ncbi:TIGR04282 family arsenosugar biosynthesis glycosyltransferase [Billgrantia gudaonensis]|uniref:Glycosyltransferase n=1 Tax=Billgrantia gudaonensis TaxID=376427 RepID=A0A1G8W8Z5_9GAMM|nr:TIGR04282 family arsenosugar biosynthesis glycosyltransferase [Halomonas gudaonensis]SDJ74010.1 hypothetical protein SAMN04487954_107174 [Halomonas gudaonensis]
MSADRGPFPLAILAKAPLPGRVKTRLIPSMDAEAAAGLHERLLRHTLEQALQATPAPCITLWTALNHAHPLFHELVSRHGIARKAQPEGDLGQRMHHALAAISGPGLIVGSDCPVLTPTLLRSCWQALATADVVCLPAEDGGYALIGARRAEPRLFDGIDWGTDRVMAQTRQRIETLGWRLACPAMVWDVDRPEDVERWQREERLAEEPRGPAC